MDTDKKIAPPEITMPDMQPFNIEAGFELRINHISDHIKVLLVHGQAEVFGMELPIGEPIFFHSGEKFAIFCWKQSQIQISGELEVYPSNMTPMHIYVNLQCALDQLRQQALRNKEVGPAILITGSQQSGKSTLAKILTNYSIKLGWQPILADIDLMSGTYSPPGSISATVVNHPLPNRYCSSQTTSIFHGSYRIVTHELFNKQVNELAFATKKKLENDLSSFMQQMQCSEQDSQICPYNPELYASGTIVIGFTPVDKRETESLCQAIKAFNVQVVLVIDNEKLERDIQQQLNQQASNNALQSKSNFATLNQNQQQQKQQIKVIKVPKSPGIQTQPIIHEMHQNMIFQSYLDYFRGPFHDLFVKTVEKRQELKMPNYLRHELDPQPANLPFDLIEIFQVNRYKIHLSMLPASATQAEETTSLDPVKDLDKNMNNYRGKVLANVVPRDLKAMKALEQQILQSPQNQELHKEFKDLLLTAFTTEFVWIKDFKVDTNTQKKSLVVIRSCATSQQNGGATGVVNGTNSGQQAQISGGNQGAGVMAGATTGMDETEMMIAQSEEIIDFPSKYFLLSEYKLNSTIF